MLKKKLVLFIVSLSLITGLAVQECLSLRKANLRYASKVQYRNYVNALYLYKEEYGYWPPFFEGRERVDVSRHPDLEKFVIALSAKTPDGKSIQKPWSSRRPRVFHVFNDDELKFSDNGHWRIVDWVDSKSIFVCVDHDGDGVIEIPLSESSLSIKLPVTVYSLDEKGEVLVSVWD